MLRDKCLKENEVIDPKKAFQIMNNAQRDEDPEAYEPEFVVLMRKQKEEREMFKNVKQRDPLFDFDDSVDKLSDVSERYKL